MKLIDALSLLSLKNGKLSPLPFAEQTFQFAGFLYPFICKGVYRNVKGL
jgi:hypothetical protein